MYFISKYTSAFFLFWAFTLSTLALTWAHAQNKSVQQIKKEKKMAEKVKVRITAKEDNKRRFAVVFMNEKIAVAFDRDSGAKIGDGVRMIDGEIDSGGSRVNWYCIVKMDSVFELEVDQEVFYKNKNRIKKWDIQLIENFSIN